MLEPKIPEAPNSIEKGVPLKQVLGEKAIQQLAENLGIVYPDFDQNAFTQEALKGIEPLSITQRAKKIAASMKRFLPNNYSSAMAIILQSLTPPLEKTQDNGLATMFYMPHASFIGQFGLNKNYNHGKDPFELSMQANYEITQRFTAEFSIRPFIIDQQERSFKQLYEWMHDSNPHVRRLCSEGSRPKLPWASHIPSLIQDPSPSLPILEQLKNDESLYVRRSVANHLGDIAKNHLELVLDTCENWLKDASHELKWVIRHALRHPAKKQNQRALKIRVAAK